MAEEAGLMTNGLMATVSLDQEGAVEMARQSLTGCGIITSKDWHARDVESCWLV
ncbi:MAG: hypothetical protein QGI79_06720 [Dehalococcoidia bacterium]|nr:hypothetical protein [Dehalococcoidia bacterium]